MENHILIIKTLLKTENTILYISLETKLDNLNCTNNMSFFETELYLSQEKYHEKSDIIFK